MMALVRSEGDGSAAHEPQTVHARLAMLAAVLAGVSLVGWATDVLLFTTFVPGRPSLSPMTATVLLLAAPAVAGLPGHRRLALWLGAIETACGVGIVVAQALSLPTLHFLPHDWWSSRLSGMAFTLSGTATVLLALGRFTGGQIVALGVLLFASLIGLGHVFPNADLYAIMPGTGVAIPSVLAFMALSVSQLLVCRSRGIAGALTRRSPAGKAGLRLLFGGLAAVLLLALAVVVGRHHEVFDADTAVLLMAWGAIALQGSALWGLAVAVDRAEGARAAAERDRDRTQHMVAAAVAHDLRNPLSTAVMTVSLLERSTVDPQVQTAVQRLQRSHRRLDRLLRSLLDSMTVSAGRPLAMKASPCVLHELVAEVVDENSGALGERVTCEGEAQGWWDHDALFRVIENLLLNAVKYGDGESPIACRIVHAGDAQVAFTVANRGAAIPPDEWEAIFHPFTRGRGTCGREQGGWGVGLAYARAVVAGHGGSIAVAESDARVTSFRMQLPVDARPGLGRFE